jgi:trehalose 6-phosphate synthase/phosphatase
VGRVLLVSNRLPVTVRLDGGAIEVERRTGGLAASLSGPHQRSGGLWIGWPGETGALDDKAREVLASRCKALRLVPVSLSKEEVRDYYERYSNGVLWPVFHYFLGEAPLHVRDGQAYERVNERFAEAIAEVWRPGDVVWVQDFQLLRVPALLRKRIPHARIGFFLHVPFPATDVFRTLPDRAALLEGMLASDLIGFHTSGYARHFTSAVEAILGARIGPDSVWWNEREVRIGAFPMGVDATAFGRKAIGADVDARVRDIRGADHGGRVLLGIDRLDYTKGILRRLLSFERLLQLHPELRGKVRMIQVAVPSRTNVDAYQDFRAEVDRIAGRINGAFATARWTPVHYLYRSLSEQEVIDLYRAADVMLVTPLRDGMNLVAKEFVASRIDGDGVLLLSEFAGAASELPDAVLVNPYDVDGVADALVYALTLPEEERRARMRGLRSRVTRWDAARWASSFLESMESSCLARPTRP